MTSQHDKPKRWRLRFSVRTLVIVVGLLAGYFWCWHLTEKGIDDVSAIAGRLSYEGEAITFGTPMPFIVSIRELETLSFESLGFGTDQRHHYYFWFFGFVRKMPLQVVK